MIQNAKPSKISNPYVNLQAGLTIRDVSLLALYLGIPTKYRVRFCFCPQTYFFIKSQHQKTTQGEPSGNSRPPHIICRFRRSLPPLWTASHTHYHPSDPTPICFKGHFPHFIISAANKQTSKSQGKIDFFSYRICRPIGYMRKTPFQVSSHLAVTKCRIIVDSHS